MYVPRIETLYYRVVDRVWCEPPAKTPDTHQLQSYRISLELLSPPPAREQLNFHFNHLETS